MHSSDYLNALDIIPRVRDKFGDGAYREYNDSVNTYLQDKCQRFN